MKPIFIVCVLFSLSNVVSSFLLPNRISPFSNRNNLNNLIMKNKLNMKNNNLKNIDDKINNFVDKIKDLKKKRRDHELIPELNTHIDDKINDYVDKIKDLKKKKNNLIGVVPGLKLLNDDDINDIKIDTNSDNTSDDPTTQTEIDDDDGIDDDEEPEEPKFGIRIIFNQEPPQPPKSKTASENFQIIKNSTYSFKDIGGYENIKEELMQCADMLVNYEKYKKFNIRTPKGIILEGPPGNGKTLLAKCFSGEINVSFIAVSGSQFQEKYVGVGASRVRELFKLADENKPCIIFIDEIDAMGKTRSSESTNNSERDDTLNELLVALDGFNAHDGVFIIGATNRIDLLDHALIRPGRIDKNIFIGPPDKNTRQAILDIHLKGKPHDESINIELLLEMTQGFSGAEIENLLNEAMLYALRNNREQITTTDLEQVLNRILVGWQSAPIQMSPELLYKIAIHEMGHAVCGLLTDHDKLIKVSLNMNSPKTPGYTLFEVNEQESSLRTKNKLFSHLMVLLSGRIAEEEFFNQAITTGASHDLEVAKALSERMILVYGMGSSLIYPTSSEKYKEVIDNEINLLLQTAYDKAKVIIKMAKEMMHECATLLMVDNVLLADTIINKMKKDYPHLQLFNK